MGDESVGRAPADVAAGAAQYPAWTATAIALTGIALTAHGPAQLLRNRDLDALIPLLAGLGGTVALFALVRALTRGSRTSPLPAIALVAVPAALAVGLGVVGGAYAEFPLQSAAGQLELALRVEALGLGASAALAGGAAWGIALAAFARTTKRNVSAAVLYAAASFVAQSSAAILPTLYGLIGVLPALACWGVPGALAFAGTAAHAQDAGPDTRAMAVHAPGYALIGVLLAFGATARADLALAFGAIENSDAPSALGIAAHTTASAEHWWLALLAVAGAVLLLWLVLTAMVLAIHRPPFASLLACWLLVLAGSAWLVAWAPSVPAVMALAEAPPTPRASE